MAIAPTGAIYKALSFDGTSSRNYGVYITGEAVYNAPERDVEMITIPGRNGTFAMDKGRFENITVTYPASIAATTEADYRQALSDFRNFLCSKKGYVRLSDDYNPDEYRMAVYKSGLEVTTAQLRAGEFDIVFECKSQRFLTSGETAVTVANNGTLSNPTLFPSRPLLEVKGKGTIHMGDDDIYLNPEERGWGIVGSASRNPANDTITYTINNGSYLNSGDQLKINRLGWKIAWGIANPIYTGVLRTLTRSLTSATGTGYYDSTFSEVGFSGSTPLTFSYGTSSTKTYTVVVGYSYTYRGTAHTGSVTITCTAVYNGSTTITCSCSVTMGASDQYLSVSLMTGLEAMPYSDQVTGYSTKSVTDTIYVDLDIGEAYTIVNNVYVSLNDRVTLPAKLPELKPGTTTFTYGNTITSLKVMPRWWKL